MMQLSMYDKQDDQLKIMVLCSPNNMPIATLHDKEVSSASNSLCV